MDITNHDITDDEMKQMRPQENDPLYSLKFSINNDIEYKFQLIIKYKAFDTKIIDSKNDLINNVKNNECTEKSCYIKYNDLFKKLDEANKNIKLLLEYKKNSYLYNLYYSLDITELTHKIELEIQDIMSLSYCISHKLMYSYLLTYEPSYTVQY